MSVDKRITAFLELAEKDLDAARLLGAGDNRYAGYHVQQALEKLVKAVLLHAGVEAGIEHRLEELIKRLPAESPWLARVTSFIRYSAYATAFRYPTPGGRIPAAEPQDALLKDIPSILKLVEHARVELI